MKKSLSVAMIMACASLTACASGDSKPKPMCPQVAILRTLDKADDHGHETPDPSTLVSMAKMDKVTGRCDYGEKGVDVSFTLMLSAEKGPRLGSERAAFPYFVSVVDDADQIKAKELMTAEFTFSGEAKQTTLEQPLHVFIPLSKEDNGGAMRVLLGFQMTESQRKETTIKVDTDTPTE
jgi:hypothetical protein